jgi:hypothetical protein
MTRYGIFALVLIIFVIVITCYYLSTEQCHVKEVDVYQPHFDPEPTIEESAESLYDSLKFLQSSGQLPIDDNDQNIDESLMKTASILVEKYGPNVDLTNAEAIKIFQQIYNDNRG